MTNRSSQLAALSTAVLAVGLGLGFVAGAGTALADTSSSSTMTVTDSATSVAGSTVTADGTIVVKDVVQNTGVERQTYTITAVAPDGSSTVIGSKDVDPGHQNTITGTLKTASFPTSGEAMNGTYTFTSSGTSDTAQTTLQIAPAAVSGVTATASSSKFTIGWSAETYPDLTGYVVTESDGRSETVSPSAANCSSSSSCSFTAAKGSDAAGTDYSFSVVAERCKAPAAAGATCDTLVSPASSPASAMLTGKAGGSGSSKNNGGGGSTSLPGESTTGTTGATGPKAVDGIGNNGFTKGGHLQAFVPSSGTTLPTADLPTLNLPSAAKALPGGEGAAAPDLPQGTYNSKLPYSGKAGSSPSGSDTASGQSVTTAFVNVFDNASFWRALGLAAVLLLAGSHLLVWLRRVPVEV